MRAKDRLLAYQAVLAHAAGQMQNLPADHPNRKTNEELLGGPDGALDYDLLVGQAQLAGDLVNGDGNTQKLAALLEPLYRFALRVSEGHMSVAASVKAAAEKEAAERKAAETQAPAPTLPTAPAGLSA